MESFYLVGVACLHLYVGGIIAHNIVRLKLRPFPYSIGQLTFPHWEKTTNFNFRLPSVSERGLFKLYGEATKKRSIKRFNIRHFEHVYLPAQALVGGIHKYIRAFCAGARMKIASKGALVFFWRKEFSYKGLLSRLCIINIQHLPSLFPKRVSVVQH